MEDDTGFYENLVGTPGTVTYGDDGKVLGRTEGSTGYVGTALGIAKAGTGLANAYVSFKNYELAQDQFKFNKALTNSNILNQGTTINAGIDNRKDVGLAMGTAALTDADRAAFTARMDSKKVNTTAI